MGPMPPSFLLAYFVFLRPTERPSITRSAVQPVFTGCVRRAFERSNKAAARRRRSDRLSAALPPFLPSPFARSPALCPAAKRSTKAERRRCLVWLYRRSPSSSFFNGSIGCFSAAAGVERTEQEGFSTHSPLDFFLDPPSSSFPDRIYRTFKIVRAI